MTKRIEIIRHTANAFEAESYQVPGTDGWPEGVIIPRVHVEAKDGTSYVFAANGLTHTDDEGMIHHHPHHDLMAMAKLAKRVNEAGSIDPAHWMTHDQFKDMVRASWAQDI